MFRQYWDFHNEKYQSNSLKKKKKKTLKFKILGIKAERQTEKKVKFCLTLQTAVSRRYKIANICICHSESTGYFVYVI